jgi:hypothetical protein
MYGGRKMQQDLKKFILPKDCQDVLQAAKSIVIPRNRNELAELSMGGKDDIFDVSYDVNGKEVKEVVLTKCKNGVVINYTTDYMRRRDPDSLIVGDDKPTDAPRFKDIYGKSFEDLRTDTMEWLRGQDLIVMPYMAGGPECNFPGLLVAPKNAAFFAMGLADLQFFVNVDDIKDDFNVRVIIYLAPPFRHTHLKGKQVVVHNRRSDVYELFSYNLYPGPSAKKGLYGFYLDVGEREGWATVHASAVKITTPYDNEIVIMHEGASGSGKSEMSEHMHRLPDGRILAATNTVTGDKVVIQLSESCDLLPISDDITLVHPSMQNPDSKRIVIKDAENGWFWRLDHIKQYGTEPALEKTTVMPPMPLIFMSLDVTPGSTALIWEHILDSTGIPCKNPRVIMPKNAIETLSTPVEVDVRSFGVRTPPCTAENPSYGIIGMMHVLPPALAWLWRLVAPRGHDNPSIDNSGRAPALESEGVGSYGPFLTGSVVKQANLLLDQILAGSSTRYVLFPNQHVGCYKVSFQPQWLSREYIARRGSAKFKPSSLIPARCPLLGFTLDSFKVDGQYIRSSLLRVEKQAEVGTKGYDEGAKILRDFFKKELKKFNKPDLNPLGKKIIECCLRDVSLEEYIDLIPMRY